MSRDFPAELQFFNSLRYLCFTLFLFVVTVYRTTQDDINCDPESGNQTTIIYSATSSRTGTVSSSKNFPKYYAGNLTCIVYLIGNDNERVQMNFSESFDIKAVPPRCLHDYLDIYTMVKDEHEDILSVPLHGRYCGKERVSQWIRSMTNILVIAFYTDESKDEAGGFKIDYEFISDTVYRIGTPAAADVCGVTINQQTTGSLLSPTYPGMYPDNIFCYYLLSGVRGQRIRLTFHEIDIFSAGDHCPFDNIKIFDGPLNTNYTIATICGVHKELVLFSTTEHLHIDFATKSGRHPAIQLRKKEKVESRMIGFNATFLMSDSFIRTDYMSKGEHIIGTECDRIIQSTKNESSGVIHSPNFPAQYPVNVVCQYYIDGMIDKQNLEKVEFSVKFLNLGLPKVGGRCKSGFLRAYTTGQVFDKETMDFDKPPDEEFCGSGSDGRTITTHTPRLILVFNSTPEIPASFGESKVKEGMKFGFSASYKFITNFAIEGTPANSDERCHFLYYSWAGVQGTFNSPRHPSSYPDNTYCLYEFKGRQDEHIRITFENFNIEEGPGSNCTKDYLSIRAPRTNSDDLRPVGKYCGSKLPGPIDEDSDTLEVTLVSDKEGVGQQGFRAKYEFIKRDTKQNNITRISSSFGGIVESPNYPNKYSTNASREWRITASSTLSKIMLTFDEFYLEGNPNEKMGCGNAVLKIYTDNGGIPERELCGESKSIQSLVIISTKNFMRIKFISSAKATGERGFRLPWTQILPYSSHGGTCQGFRCKVTQHCISPTLKCNRVNNCGQNDTSDEPIDCGPASHEHGALNIILGVVVGLIVVIIIVVYAIHRRRKTTRAGRKEIEVRFMTRSDSNEYSTGNGLVDGDEAEGGKGVANGGRTLLKLKTEKVSII